MSNRSPSRLLVSTVAFCAAVLLALTCLPLFRGEIHGGVDLTQNDYPTRILYAHGLKQGRLNLWNPQLFRGYRLHGEGQTGMCHPWHLLIYGLLPPAAALWLDLVAAFPLAFIGALLLFRRWQLDPGSACFGASVFAFGSYFFAHFGHMSLLIVHAHLPWLLFFLDRCLCERRAFGAGAAGTACVVGSALLLGHPQSAWMVLLAGALYAVFRCEAPLWCRDRVRRSLVVAGSVALGVLLGSVQILPTLAALARSPRGNLGPGMRYNFSLHPANALQFLNPFVFAETTVGNLLVPAAGQPPVYNNNIAEYSVYGGAALLCLLVAVWVPHWREFVAGGARRVCLFLLALCVLGGVLAVGRWGGLFVVLGCVPVVREFRCAARHINFVQFACAGLGAFAMARVVGKRQSLHWRFLVSVPLLCASLTVVALVFGGAFSGTRFEVSSWPWLLAGPLFAGLGACVLAVSDRVRWAPALFACVCLADLGLFGLRIIVPVDEIDLSEVGKLYLAYENPPEVNRELRLWAPANSGVWKGFYLANGYCGMPPGEPLESEPDPLQAMRLASVGMVWTPDGWQNVPDTLSRFRLVGQVVPDTPENREADVRKTARVTHYKTPLPHIAPGAGSVRVVAEQPMRIDLEVDSETDQLLVCSDRFDTDWHAAVDGRPARLLALHSGALRGVAVPSGHHRVTMEYRSRAFAAGALLTWAGVLVLGVLSVWCAVKRSRSC